MHRTTLVIAAAAAGALTLFAVDAQAKPKKPLPQQFQYKVGRKVYKDNNPARPTAKVFEYASGGVPVLTFNAMNIKVGLGGAVQNLANGSVLGFPNPTTATFPLTVTAAEAGDGLTFIYSSGSNSWHDDPSQPFTMTFTSYNATTGRLAGKFSGTLVAGLSNDAKHLKPVKIKSGKCNAEVSIH